MVRAYSFERFYFPVAFVAMYASIAFLLYGVSVGSFSKPAAPSSLAAMLPQPSVGSQENLVSGRPVRVVVPSVSIDLPVVDGAYDTASGTWSIGNYQAYYATPTPPVNDSSGTTLIYGHNNRTAFRTLSDVQLGAELVVYTGAGTIFRYSLTDAHEVQPSDTNILSYDGPPTVILQTCSGNWNEFRKLYIFKLESVERQAA